MSAQPKALSIADECEQSAEEWLQEVDTRMQAAAELRRLHAENKELVADRDSWADQASERLKDWDGLRQICEEKNALLRQALELLEDNREDVARVETTYMHTHYDPVLHAIKRHLENGS